MEVISAVPLAPTRRRAYTWAISLALALPVVPTAYAVDIYYARAIGQEYLPEPAPSSKETPTPTETPKTRAEPPPPDLPSLGAREQSEAPEQGMSTWTKILIGTVVVAAIAAVGNSGGGGGDPTAATGSAPPDGGGSGSGRPGRIGIGLGTVGR